MIKDKIGYLGQYDCVNKHFSKIIEFLCKNDLVSLPLGAYQLGDECFVNLLEYEPGDNQVFEAHEKYIDVQLIVSGCERIDCVDVSEIDVTSEYDQNKDCLLGKVKVNNSTKLIVGKDCFAVFFPQDAHCPSIKIADGKVRKAVFKLKVN